MPTKFYIYLINTPNIMTRFGDREEQLDNSIDATKQVQRIEDAWPAALGVGMHACGSKAKASAPPPTVIVKAPEAAPAAPIVAEEPPKKAIDTTVVDIVAKVDVVEKEVEKKLGGAAITEEKKIEEMTKIAKETADKKGDEATTVETVAQEITEDDVVAVVADAAATMTPKSTTKLFHMGSKYKPHLMTPGKKMKPAYCYGIAAEKTETETNIYTYMCPGEKYSCPTKLNDKCDMHLVTSVPHAVNKMDVQNGSMLKY